METGKHQAKQVHREDTQEAGSQRSVTLYPALASYSSSSLGFAPDSLNMKNMTDSGQAYENIMDHSTLPQSEISSLSDNQERLISSLSLVSGSLSVLGSSMIVYMVIKNPRKTPVKRILLGLSLCDIIASITYATQPFLLPSDTSQRVWARGTEASCSFLGFLTQVAFSAIWYNGMLSYYYLLTVRFGVKTATFASRFEPGVHILCLGYNLGTAIVGYAMGFYSEMELGQGCWIAEYPKDCEATGNCTGTYIGWIYGGVPTVFMFVSILINNIIIYCYVRRTIKRSMNKSMRGVHRQQQRIQAVATQAFLYVGTFMIAYIWAFAIKVAESIGIQAADEARIFPVLVLQALFLPMQGVFNLFVYSRPDYLRCRHEFPEESRLCALQRVWFGAKTQKGPTSSLVASLWSKHHSTRPIADSKEARQHEAAQFTAPFSLKDPLREQSVTINPSPTEELRQNSFGWQLEVGRSSSIFLAETRNEPHSEHVLDPSSGPLDDKPVLDRSDEPILEEIVDDHFLEETERRKMERAGAMRMKCAVPQSVGAKTETEMPI